MEVEKNVYGLNDAARAWYSRLKDCLLGLGMRVSRLDPALFFWRRKNVLSGVMCVHVDDILWAGTEEFFTTIVADMKDNLTIGTSNDGKSFKYIGVNIAQEDGVLGLHQNDYVDSLEEIGLSRARASRRLDHGCHSRTKIRGQKKLRTSRTLHCYFFYSFIQMFMNGSCGTFLGLDTTTSPINFLIHKKMFNSKNSQHISTKISGQLNW
ncbi:unnamed protein product [Meganyctiphanes norvegica]|uniref:Reverse transcriptase Ty1/copia-type domain-containing protein n=1 Tax=Meganyctiphanes norvegica TaxID=48144 RepID=A0AAV2PL69_MEGNR